MRFGMRLIRESLLVRYVVWRVNGKEGRVSKESSDIPGVPTQRAKQGSIPIHYDESMRLS